MTENRSSTLDPNHNTLSRHAFVQTTSAFGGWVYLRVDRYDADAGELDLGDPENDGSDGWRYDGTRWVCTNLTEEDGTPVTETEFTGAARCLRCGTVYETPYPDEHYCGC